MCTYYVESNIELLFDMGCIVTHIDVTMYSRLSTVYNCLSFYSCML